MTNLTESTKNLNGFHYFALGWRLITRPGLKRFVILPLLANIIILGSAFWWLYGQIGEMVNWMMEKVPDWLQWLSYVIWPLSVIFILLVFTYFFSTIGYRLIRYYKRYSTYFKTRNHQGRLLFAKSHCIVIALFCSRCWTNYRPNSLVYIWCLDDGNTI